jgi:hypothetical protein
MNQLHASIRREAAVSVALAHPEIRLEDIGIALGYKPLSAKSMVSLFLEEAGISRPRGAGSPAFDQKTLLRGSKLDEHRDEIRTMLRKNMSYSEMAKQLRCDSSLVAEYCRKHWGVSRGKGWRENLIKVSDEKIIAAAKAHPELSITKLGVLLGYSKKCGGFQRRYRELVKNA